MFSGSEILHVGPGYAGTADSVIDGAGFMAIPGFVNVHSHPFSEPANKGLTEEVGSDKLGQSSLYEFLPVFGLDAEDAGPSTTVALSELLKSGVTTITDLSISRPGWLDDLAASGIRAVVAPMMRQGYWFTKNGHTVDYAWDEKAGEKAFEAAMQTIDRALQHPSGRIVGDGLPVADRHLPRGLLQGGAAGGEEARHPDADARLPGGRRVPRDGPPPRQDADRMARRHRRAGAGPGDRPRHLPQRPSADPLSARPRLRASCSDSGAAVAHCPTVFARRGMALNTIGRYMNAGITVGIGTDTFPHNMVDEIRLACYVARVLTGNYKMGTTRHAFEAATVGGAKILRRPDLGRLAPGCKADFSLVDMSHPYMQPAHEPVQKPDLLGGRSRHPPRLCRRPAGGEGRQGADRRRRGGDRRAGRGPAQAPEDRAASATGPAAPPTSSPRRSTATTDRLPQSRPVT